MLRDVVLPSALPELANGVRTALALSFVLLVSSELIVARSGLGYLIGFLGEGGVYDAMFAVVLIVAFLGFFADRAYQVVGEAGARMARMISRVIPLGARCIAIVVAWQMLVASGAVTPFMLPSPGVVAGRIWTDARLGRARAEPRAHALPRALRLRHRRRRGHRARRRSSPAAARCAGCSTR